MADLEKALGSILSDPDAMRQVMKLGEELGLTGNSSAAAQSPPAGNNTADKMPDISALASLLSGSSYNSNTPVHSNISHTGDAFSPEILSAVTRFLPLLSDAGRDDETTALLQALRPFLSDSKRRRLDDAGKMLRIMRLLPMIKNAGLF